jgi:hypothetical protein
MRGTIGLLLLATLMVAWSSIIAHNLTRAEKLIGPVPPSSQRDLLALGTDFEEYTDYFRSYPRSITEATKANVFSEFHKRPLYGPISSTLNIWLHALGITYPNSMFMVLSLYAACCSLLLYCLLQLMRLSPLQSFILTASATISFGWLSIFSLPESYSLTICAMLAAMIAATLVLQAPPERFKISVMALAVVLGICGWLYLPIAGALALVVPRFRSLKEAAIALLPAAIVIVAVATFPHVAKGRSDVSLLITHGTEWSSLWHLFSVRNWIDVAAAFLIFSFLAPVDDLVSAVSTLSWEVILGSPALVAWFCLSIAAYAVALWIVVKRGYLWRLSGAAAWLFGLIAFYVYFNPIEALLYLSLPVTLVVYMVAQVLSAEADVEGAPGALRSFSDRAATHILAGLALACVASMNLSAVVGR